MSSNRVVQILSLFIGVLTQNFESSFFFNGSFTSSSFTSRGQQFSRIGEVSLG